MYAICQSPIDQRIEILRKGIIKTVFFFMNRMAVANRNVTRKISKKKYGKFFHHTSSFHSG
jgi:hypothetical protein